jgi:anti-anti-sigma regulatory factor
MDDLQSRTDRSNVVYADGLLRISRTRQPGGLCLTGDVDESNVDAVTVALSVAQRDGGDLHVDLGGLQFCDVGGLRALVAAAGDLGPDRRLVLHGLTGRLQRVMRVIGWDRSAGLTIVQRSGGAPSALADEVGA